VVYSVGQVDDKKAAETRFTDLLTRLVRVPKDEVDEQETKYRQARDHDAEPAKAGQIVPSPRRRLG
jgi:hypothetical protein